MSEFNDIINKEIANQPTPYLYEKLGVRLFITNILLMSFKTHQNFNGKNILPLISHALDSLDENEEQGSLFFGGRP